MKVNQISQTAANDAALLTKIEAHEAKYLNDSIHQLTVVLAPSGCRCPQRVVIFTLVPYLHLNQLIVTHRYLSPILIACLVNSLVMDPFPIAAGTVGILDCIARLSSAMSRFKDNYKLADADWDIARQHVLLSKQE